MAQMELLQDIQIRKAKGQDNIYYLNDGGGLRLKITPTNSKIWEFRYTYNPYKIVTKNKNSLK